MTSQGFAPTGKATARVLVLGTLPGGRSLASNQYYSQPGNLFWPLMGHLFGAGLATPYDVRLKVLADHGVALWDVCRAAVRPGSLDSAIDQASVVPNDLAGFYATHPNLQRVCFNGLEAARLFQRLVHPVLGGSHHHLDYVVLPSTSGANAAISFEEKLQRWTAALRHLPKPPPPHCGTNPPEGTPAAGA